LRINDFGKDSMNAKQQLACFILWGSLALPFASQAAGIDKIAIDGRLQSQAARREAPVTTGTMLRGAPDYQWWYGCSPTAAGMLLGYYDINGYRGEAYTNLVPDAVAEVSTFPSTEGRWDYDVQHIIASPRHVSDFYAGGYLAIGDDVPGAPTGPLDSLADFMGTSQDAYENSNGSTWFFVFEDGSKLTVADIYNYSLSSGDPAIYGASGAYGIYEFLIWAGYGDRNPLTVDYIYNQYVDSLGKAYGFGFVDYQAEINAGRAVILHLEGHSVLGYGYDSTTGELLIHDTANPGEQRMSWEGSYLGLRLNLVTVVDLTDIPGDQEPPADKDSFPWELFMPAILHSSK
jgi:hypothetical protein